MMRRSAAPRVSEKSEQAHIVQLLRSLGARVYIIGTTRRRGDHQGTMQTPGIPDLMAFLPLRSWGKCPCSGTDVSECTCDSCGANRTVRDVLLFIECKAKGGRLRPEQATFRALAQAARIAHVVGDLNAVIEWCIENGYLRPDSVPHYRLPKMAAEATR